ncbi:MAG: hypothetical protein B7Z74_08935 [Deltaproteobacteria bacterium 21-66-5]|nr:MAG: hypothetical protein B7Z74_08935 [Deltaproteobacteria bacterium 21-66-5]
MSLERTHIAVAVIEWHGSFLVGRRPDGVPLAGLWEFPGGKVEPNETARLAAAREALEETGVAVEVGPEYPLVNYDYSHDRVLLHFFACTPLEPYSIPRPPFEWVPAAKLAALQFPPANAGLIERLVGKGSEMKDATG